MTLIEGGAHIDAVNSYGETPFQAATTGVAEIILRTQTKLSLKCIAAKVIKQYSLPYKDQVPRPLESFIELHGTGKTERWTEDFLFFFFFSRCFLRQAANLLSQQRPASLSITEPADDGNLKKNETQS